MTSVNLLLPVDVHPGQLRPDRDAILHMQIGGETMGTRWSASWFCMPGIDPADVQQKFDAIFKTMIASMSPWEPASIISRFNALSAGQYVDMDEHFASVLQRALKLAESTDGAFDPCLGGEVLRRGFGAAGIAPTPDEPVHGAAAWRALVPEQGRLRQPGHVTLDLSAIAKGYAVDRMADTLQSSGVSQFLVEIGGEYVAQGVKPDRSPWWIDLERPDIQQPRWRIALVGEALATSGDWRQKRMINGQTVSHIVGAQGRAGEFGDLASVSVIASECADADGWATALYAAGDRHGLKLADAHGIEAIFQYRGASAQLSQSMMARLDGQDGVVRLMQSGLCFSRNTPA